MWTADAVTFGGSDLDRSAAERNDSNGLARALCSGAVVLPMWRGKPLVQQGETPDLVRLVRLAADSPVLARAHEPAVFLGRVAGEPVFARDMSGWQPVEVDEAQIGAFLDRTEQVHPAGPKGAAFRELRGVMTALDARDAELAATARAILTWHRTHRFCARCGAESEMSQAGWQRTCPGCGASHFPRTDPVVIMLITHGDNVLVGRSPGWPEGMYSLLAGFVEPGETIEAAVRREVLEESGVQVGAVRYAACQPWPYPASLMFGCLGEATTTEITIDPVEIEDAIWVSRSDMLEVFAGRHPRIKPARKGAIAHFLLERWLADRLA